MPGGPIIRRLSDPAVPWQRVKAQRNADGTESSVWEKWFAFRDDPDAFEQACSERGITPLPDPEIDFPDWLEDERGRWIDSLTGSDPEDGADSLTGGDPEDGAGSEVGGEPQE